MDLDAVCAMIANLERDAYERGRRAGRAETLDEAARKTAEFGSLSKHPSGRLIDSEPSGVFPSARIKSADGGCGNG